MVRNRAREQADIFALVLHDRPTSLLSRPKTPPRFGIRRDAVPVTWQGGYAVCICAGFAREQRYRTLQVQEKGARPPRTGLARNVLSKYFLTDPSNLSTYAVMKASAPGQVGIIGYVDTCGERHFCLIQDAVLSASLPAVYIR